MIASTGPVAVTGASGFLGRALCANLVATGVAVRSIHRGHSGAPPHTESVVVTDLTDRAALRRAMRGVSSVVHLAAKVHMMDERSIDSLAAYQRTNVAGTAFVVEEATAAGVGQIIFASSVKAMGDHTTTPWTEVTPPQPVDPYGESKWEAEQLVAAAALNGIDCVSLRFPAMYGRGVRANFLQMLKLVDRGMPLPLGGIENKRSLLYVGNAAAAIRRLIEARLPGARTYLLSDGDDLSTPELIRRLALTLGRPARLMTVPTAALRAAGALGDLVNGLLPTGLTSAAVARLTSSLQVDSSRFRKELDFGAPFTVEQGLEATVEWFRSTTEGAR